MAYEGWIDNTHERGIAGWVFDDSRPNESLVVEVMAGEDVVATVKADLFRQDLLDLGKGNGKHMYRWEFPDGARVPGPVLSARIKGKRWHIQHNSPGKPAPVFQDPRRMYAHSLDFGYPQVPTGFSVASSSPGDAKVVERVIEAFHRTLADDPARSREKDIWSQVHDAFHREPWDLLKRRDAAGFDQYMRDAHAHGITWGITQGPDATHQVRTIPEAARAVSTMYADNLVSLAEFLGVLDVECPEQRGPYGENLHMDPQVLVDRIAGLAGIPVETPPAIGSYFGIRTKGGIVTGRDLCALFVALRLRDVARELSLAKPVVCEIGGGMGGVAYYCARLGMRHTVIDLPLVSALQGYFLLRAMPDADIRLYGEGDSPDAAVRLLPTYKFGEACDLLVNQDSFPEMNSAYSLGYLRQAKECVRHAFFSVNQEARAPQHRDAKQTVVRELVAEAGGFRRVSRNRHWLRAGYVEELYLKA